MSTDNGNVLVRVETEAIKGVSNATREQLEAQAAAARECLEDADYHKVRGTCIDDRGREKDQARPSVSGGPDVYGMAVMELTGIVPAGMTTGKQVLAESKKRINGAGIRSGGHKRCAANGDFVDWMRIVAEHPEAVEPYVKKEIGDESYDPAYLATVSANAKNALASGRYDGWNEIVLAEVLGDEADDAIETLLPGPHDANTLVRQKQRNKTVNQTKLVGISRYGGGSYVQDDPYAEDIEAAVTSSPDAVHLMTLARYAREAILAAVATVVPSDPIYQIDLAAA